MTALRQLLALPPLDQHMLAIFCVVHEPLNRTGMVEWLKASELRNELGRTIGTSELAPRVEAWQALGLVIDVSEPHAAHKAYRVGALRHALLAHLAESGQLRALTERVRGRAPCRESYGMVKPQRLARELLWMAHLEFRDDVVAQLVSLRTFGCHEKPGDLLLDAFGLAAPARDVARLGPALAKDYLAAAFAFAIEHLRPLSEGPLELLGQLAASAEHVLLAQAATYHALRGEHALASSCLGERAGAECSAARALIALGTGELSAARDHARQALEHTRTKKSKKLKGLHGPLTPWVVLALLTDTDEDTTASSLELARAQLKISLDRRSLEGFALHHLMGFHAFLAQGTQAFMASQPHYLSHHASWLDNLLQALTLRYTQRALPRGLEPALAAMHTQAVEGGFAWLAAEHEHVLRAEGSSGLCALYHPEEPWQRSVRMLDAAIDQASQNKSTPEATVGERLVFTLLVGGAGEHRIVPRVQTENRTGFSSGRQVSWKKLSELALSAPFIEAVDRRVISHADDGPDFGPYGGGTLTGVAEEAVCALVGHPRVFADDECKKPVEVVRAAARVEVLEEGGELVVSIVPATLVTRTTHVEHDGEGRIAVYTLDAAQQPIAAQIGARGLKLPQAARASLARSLGKLAVHFPVASSLPFEATSIRDVPADPRLYVQLRRSGTGLTVRIETRPLGEAPGFWPGEGSELVVGSRVVEGLPRTVQVRRDLSDERAREVSLLAACATLASAECQHRERRIVDLSLCLELLCELRRVADDIVVEWPEGHKLAVVAERSVRDMRLTIGSAGHWLSADGELAVDGETKLALAELLTRKAEHTGRFMAVDDGRYLALSDELTRLLDTVSAHRHQRAGRIELHPHALFGLSSLADGQGTLEADEGVQKRLKLMHEAALQTPQVPVTFQATLRPYQYEGFAWMSRLAHWGAGAILADDMGLGKTLQTLALLLEHAAHGPALVVAPTSVCTNWLDEAKKFAPTLRMVRLDTSERTTTIDTLGPYDVLVCSYAIMQLEIEQLKTRRFQVVVLDEAQAIKNGSTLRSRAAMEIVADVRIALSGTPVENHLGELWSIMTFVNPGLLGSAKSFQERFARPIQRDQDRQAAQALKRIVRPFMLRRKKSEVLDDLPEKTLITLRVEPSAEEGALFATLREQALLRALDRSKPAMTRMHLLAELMRMRRAACHPDLVAPEAGLRSTKLAALEELLEELREGGHRALVFSQFVDYLTIVRGRLEQLGIGHQYLDGSSSPLARAAAVKAFQAGEGDVFLISLKAGGFGLNLTAADYVIHLDPWWNPAVEDQASDRAHRIGQERPVTIYRLVMQGSIEEKMLALHADKRQLADELLEGTGHSGALSVDELMGLLRDTPGEGAAVRRVGSVQVEA